MHQPVPKRSVLENQPLSIYVHLPVCKVRCPYCEFTVVPSSKRTGAAFHTQYTDLLLKELDRWVSEFPELRSFPLRSLYFGGGTPSMTPIPELARILAAVRNLWGSSPSAELSIECNPEGITGSQLATYRELGINRISVGIQSLHSHHLKRLGRNHGRKEALNALKLIAANDFSVWSADLMFGIPFQNRREFELDLSEILAFNPPHVSLYNLSLPRRTRLLRDEDLPSEDAQLEMLEYAITTLKAAGLERYEVSNFSRPGLESIHNQSYWLRLAYLGLGMGAHSSLEFTSGRLRVENATTLALYRSGDRSEEWIEGDLYQFENLFLALRSREGIDEETLQRYLARVDAHSADLTRKWITDGLYFRRVTGNRVAMTHEGWALSDAIWAELAPSLHPVGASL